MENNVERLGVRPVARRVPESPTIDTSVIQALITEAQQQTLQAVQQTVLQVARQAAAEAVKASLQTSSTAVVGTLHAIATILAVRLILLLAVIGGFVLAMIVVQAPSALGAALLVGYIISTVWPLVWLDIAGRSSHSAGRGV